MMTQDPFHDFVRQRQISDLILKRVAEHVYDRPLINNVERADYVECMVELIMQSADSRWRLTETWDPWDVEHPDGARIEVKQSSALQAWEGAIPNTNRRFDIRPSTGYAWECPQGIYHWLPLEPPRRLADVYIFAWHDNDDILEADHRNVAQWQFFVTHESALPQQKSIGLTPLQNLARRCTYQSLASEVLEVIPDQSHLKAKLLSPTSEPCPYC